MTIQIAVRLPEETVEFIDSLIASGRASSRAEVVARALAREERRERSLRDLEILSNDLAAGDDEFAAMRKHVAKRRVMPD